MQIKSIYILNIYFLDVDEKFKTDSLKEIKEQFIIKNKGGCMEDVVYSIWKSIMDEIESCKRELTVKGEEYEEHRKEMRHQLSILTKIMFSINEKVKITATNNITLSEKEDDNPVFSYIDFTVVKRK